MKYKFVTAETKIEELQKRQASLEEKHLQAEQELDLLMLIPEEERNEAWELNVNQRRNLMTALTEGHNQIQSLIDKVNAEETLKSKGGKKEKKTEDKSSPAADLIPLKGNRSSRRSMNGGSKKKVAVSSGTKE